MSRRFERSRQRTSTLEAICLHEYVAPERWCVTKADLRYLQHEVNNAIKEQSVAKTVFKFIDPCVLMCFVCVSIPLPKENNHNVLLDNSNFSSPCTASRGAVRHCPTKTLSVRGEAMWDAALCTCTNF